MAGAEERDLPEVRTALCILKALVTLAARRVPAALLLENVAARSAALRSMVV